MESVNYNELATLVLALCCIVVLLTFGVVYATIRIGQIQNLLQEAKRCDLNLIETCKRLEDAILAQATRLSAVRETLYKPLYEVGNTIWYNRGITGEPGVHQEHKAIIEEIIINPNAVPDYKVRGTEGEVYVSQGIITAWTN